MQLDEKDSRMSEIKLLSIIFTFQSANTASLPYSLIPIVN